MWNETNVKRNDPYDAIRTRSITNVRYDILALLRWNGLGFIDDTSETVLPVDRAEVVYALFVKNNVWSRHVLLAVHTRA